MKDLKMLAIDLGASSGRGIVGRYDGSKIRLEENHRFSNDPMMVSGQFTWDILRIWFEIKNSLRTCANSDDRDIASVGIDTWGVDYGFLDKNGHLLANPVHYRDTRTVGMIDDSTKFVSKDELYNRTGIQLLELNTVYQLLANMRDSKEIMDNAESMLHIPDLLNYFLTGIKKTEYTIASTGGLVSPYTRKWDMELIEKYGLPKNIFTEIVEPGSILGNLTNEVCEDINGINPKVVNVAAHDTGSAVLSVPQPKEKFMFISSGTWSIMGTETKEPIVNEKTKEYNFTNEGGYDGTYRFSKNITGLWLEQESRRQWAREGTKVSYDDLSNMASKAEPLKFLINPDEAAFGTPGNLPKRIAEYCQKTGQGTPETMGEIVRCIFDSLALRYRWVKDKTIELCKYDIPCVNIVGGGTKEKMLSQFASNACKVPVYTGPVEATALGNIAAQALALGEIKNVEEAREVIKNSTEMEIFEPKDTEMWDEGYERFKKLV